MPPDLVFFDAGRVGSFEQQQRRGRDGRRWDQELQQIHGSVTLVILLTAGDSFCTTPLGQRISTLSILVACPIPKCRRSELWPEYPLPPFTSRIWVWPPALSVTRAPIASRFDFTPISFNCTQFPAPS